MVAEASGRAFAATWRNEQGAVVGTTYGGTMCLWPRKPWRIRFSGEGFEGVIRCGECPGCLEFDRRRLMDRLHAKYAKAEQPVTKTPADSHPTRAGRECGPAGRLFVIRIYAPIELHASLSHKLHRRRGLELEPGMWRMGASSFAILSRETSTLPRVLRALGLRHRVHPLRLSRGRRAFRILTAGLVVAREIYGEQVKRWYARGLPMADRQKWEVKKIGAYQSYSRWRSPRAWTGRKLVLVPPEVWQLSRPDRRSLRGLLLRAPDPEGVRKVMGIVADAIRKASSRLPVSAPPQAVLSRQDVVAWYQRNADRSKARTATADPDLPVTPSSWEGGYVSSVHEQGELMPEELSRQRRKEDEAARKQRAIDESMAIIERMRKRTTGEG